MVPSLAPLPPTAIGEAGMPHSDAEINLALQTVRKNAEAEARREVPQAARNAATARPFEGGGDDHAYWTGAETAAAARAERAVDQNPSRPIPADVNQSPDPPAARITAAPRREGNEPSG